MLRRFILYLVLICLIFLPWLAWETDRNMVRRWLYPVTGHLAALSTRCDVGAPGWLEVLAKQLPTQLDSPANQIVFVDQTGVLSGCVNGWEHHPLLSKRVSATTRFRLASLSKLVTFFGVVHGPRGWLAQPLADVLPLRPPFKDPRVSEIRVRQLLNHTAGFDRMKAKDPMVIDGQKPWCPERVEQLQEVPLQFLPGSRHAYANVDYCLVAVAYERHTGRSLWRALEQDLRTPEYGLGFMDEADSKVAYNFMHNEMRGPEFVQYFDWPALRAPMGMTGNAEGLARFVADHRSLLRVAHQMHDPGIACQETLVESCYDGFLERRRVGDKRVWLQRGYLYGMASLFLTDEAGNFIVWLGAGETRPLRRGFEFVENAFLKGLSQ